MLNGVVNRFASALSAQKVGPNPECEDGAEVRIQSPDNSPGGVVSAEIAVLQYSFMHFHSF